LSGRALALVGAGSVVTKSVPPRSVVVGNPARVIRTLPIKKEGEETEAEKRRKMLGL
jgi:acetyltransferase-like isoleucine patch superfamily enzyme